jgi:NADH-quinone oxidoreductase subunit H
MKELLAIFIYPGLLFAILLGGFMEGFRRKIKARMQLRQGPPILQPFYDIGKLLFKQVIKTKEVSGFIYYFIPFIGIISLMLAFSLFPLPFNYQRNMSAFKSSFDMIIILYLWEVPLISQILFGYGTRSPYGFLGASRMVQMFFSYNIPLLIILTSIAFMVNPIPSFNLMTIAKTTWSGSDVLIKILTLPIFLICMQAEIKLNPFSIANAETEILEGIMVEASGLVLLMFEVMHYLELAAVAFLFAILYLPVLLVPPMVGLVIIILSSFMLTFIMTYFEAATARLRLAQVSSFYFKVVIPASVVMLLLSYLI